MNQAYAKLNNCYEYLDGGLPEDGIIDLTGGVEEFYLLSNIQDDHKNNFWNYIVKALKFNSMIGACIIDSESVEDVKENGLQINHAYAVSKAIEIENNSHDKAIFNELTQVYKLSNEINKIRMLRVRNPIGAQYEWNGRVGDKSSELHKTIENLKNNLTLHIEQEGEFWYLIFYIFH